MASRRRNKKIIRFLVVIKSKGDVNPLLRFFNGSYIGIGKYLDMLENSGYFIQHPSVRLTLKGEMFLKKCKQK